jgi:hypothetical protein
MICEFPPLPIPSDDPISPPKLVPEKCFKDLVYHNTVSGQILYEGTECNDLGKWYALYTGGYCWTGD